MKRQITSEKCQKYYVLAFMELTNEHFQKKEKHNYIRKMTALKIFYSRCLRLLFTLSDVENQ